MDAFFIHSRDLKGIGRSELVKDLAASVQVATGLAKMWEATRASMSNRHMEDDEKTANVQTAIDELHASLECEFTGLVNLPGHDITPLQIINYDLVCHLISLPIRKEKERFNNKWKVDVEYMVAERILVAESTEDYLEVLKFINTQIMLNRGSGKQGPSTDMEDYLAELRDGIIERVFLDGKLQMSPEQFQEYKTCFFNKINPSVHFIGLMQQVYGEIDAANFQLMKNDIVGYIKNVFPLLVATRNKQEVDQSEMFIRYAMDLKTAIIKVIEHGGDDEQKFIHNYAWVYNLRLANCVEVYPNLVMEPIPADRINMHVEDKGTDGLQYIPGDKDYLLGNTHGLDGGKLEGGHDSKPIPDAVLVEDNVNLESSSEAEGQDGNQNGDTPASLAGQSLSQVLTDLERPLDVEVAKEWDTNNP